MNKAIILLSGGMDSAVALALAKKDGFEGYALTFDYGQKNRHELTAASNIAQKLQVCEHKIIPLPLDCLQHSALTDADIAVPEYQGEQTQPVTYVPARNTIFLSIALGWAEVINAQAIYVGCSAVDYSGYRDCRPAYFHAFQQLANLARQNPQTDDELKIIAPLVDSNKAQTIELGLKLGVDLDLTTSCYNHIPDGIDCGRCDGCTYRQQGFKEVQVLCG